MSGVGRWTIGLIVAGAVTIGLWRLLAPDPRGGETPVNGSQEETAQSPALEGSRSPGQPPRLVSDRTLGLFRSGQTQLRRSILQDLLHAGIYDARLVPVLQSMLVDAALDERTRVLAQAMYTHASGDETYLRALAETALRDPQQYRLILQDGFGDSLDVVLLAATRRPFKGTPLDEDLRVDSRWPAEAVGVGLELLARMDPSAPTVRGRLEVALSSKRAIAERLGALRGYAFVKDPSSSEARLVATQLGTNELIDAASDVLELPAWSEVLERDRIPRMVQRPTPFR